MIRGTGGETIRGERSGRGGGFPEIRPVLEFVVAPHPNGLLNLVLHATPKDSDSAGVMYSHYASIRGVFIVYVSVSHEEFSVRAEFFKVAPEIDHSALDSIFTQIRRLICRTVEAEVSNLKFSTNSLENSRHLRWGVIDPERAAQQHARSIGGVEAGQARADR